MKKTVSILVCALLLCSLFTGCTTKTSLLTDAPNEEKTDVQGNGYLNTKEKRTQYVLEERNASIVLHEETFGDSVFCLYKCSEREYGVVEFFKSNGKDYLFKSYFNTMKEFPHTTYTIAGLEGDMFFVGKTDYRYVEVRYENGSERADVKQNPISFIPRHNGEKPIAFVFYDEAENKLYEETVI